MKFTAASVLVGIASTQAFMVQPVMKTSGTEPSPNTRADFAKKFTAGAVAATVAAAAPVLAKPGAGPKQNLFGVIGSDMELGGGSSNYYTGPDQYSAYSPYGTGDKALYKTGDESYMLKIKIDVLKDSQTKIQAIPKFIEQKKWEEIRSLLTAKAYSLRDAMNTLAKDKPDAANVAKVFYRDIENITVYSRLKKQDETLKAYNDAQAHLTKYLSLI